MLRVTHLYIWQLCIYDNVSDDGGVPRRKKSRSLFKKSQVKDEDSGKKDKRSYV